MELIDLRKSQLLYYSPYRAIRSITPEQHWEHWVYPAIASSQDSCIEIELHTCTFQFYIDYLEWDTAYFGFPSYKLQTVLFDPSHAELLPLAIQECMKYLPEQAYVFGEIPSEDIQLIQALGKAGWPLIETRLTYWRDQLQHFNEPRYSVRKANPSDTENLMRVARVMRNAYDRFHADPCFTAEQADEFLATYIEKSILGFADLVLVPDGPSDSFLTARYLKHDWAKTNINVSKMVLSAVSAETNKGWYKKLISEMTYHLRDEGATCIFMNTQSTNLAVTHTWESLGYQLGGTSHVFSYHQQ